MKEQYRQEMQKIHVPESLLEKTKLAMKAEEQKIKTENKVQKMIPFGKVSIVTAAAVLLLVLIPVAGGTFGTGEESLQQGQVYLAAKEEAEIFKIEAETEDEETGPGQWLKDIIDKIGELFN
jgi:hypothetical protein